MKTLLAVAAALAVAVPAEADVKIVVDPAAPFTESDLANAVHLRAGDLPAGDLVVQVGRLGSDRLVIVVGDRTETVVLPDRDRAEAARVVAVIVTSLAEDEAPPVRIAAAAPRRPAAEAPHSLWAVMLGAVIQRDEFDGFDPTIANATMARVSVARGLTSYLRAIASVSSGTATLPGGSPAHIIPTRLGFEAATGIARFEVGGEMNLGWEHDCSTRWERRYGIYGAAKVSLPIASDLSLVMEVGGHDMLGGMWDACTLSDIQYGAWAAAGVEWAL